MRIPRPVVALENLPKCSSGSVPSRYRSGTEIYRAAHCGVYAPQIQDQLAVHIQPEIIVSRELKDDVMAPRIQAVECLNKRGGHLHTEEIIRCGFRDLMQPFPVTGVVFRKQGPCYVPCICEPVRIWPRFPGRRVCERIVRHELTVIHRRLIFPLYRPQLVIYPEFAVRQICIVLCRIVFKISAFVIDASDEQMIDSRSPVIQFSEGRMIMHGDRVSGSLVDICC